MQQWESVHVLLSLGIIEMITELLTQLTHNDTVALMTLSHESMTCQSIDQFKTLVLKLKGIVNFENSVCARGNIIDILSNDEPDLEICDISYPKGCLDLYVENRYYSTDAALFCFLSTLSPINWSGIKVQTGVDYPISVNAIEFKMLDGWTHGILDPHTMDSTVFYFGGPDVMSSPRSRVIFKFIIPFFAEAYNRTLKRNINGSTSLTKKETEVLNWLKEGKSSWEISTIQKTSKRTVDFHVNNIKIKLNATSRAQAVAKGLHYGFIEF